MDPNKTYYFLIGSNNFWYAMDSSLKEAKSSLRMVESKEIDYSDPETGHTPEVPNELYIIKGQLVYEKELEQEEEET